MLARFIPHVYLIRELTMDTCKPFRCTVVMITGYAFYTAPDSASHGTETLDGQCFEIKFRFGVEQTLVLG